MKLRNKFYLLLVFIPAFVSAAEYPFDRLFTSSDERALLDRLRREPNVNLQSEATGDALPIADVKATSPDIVLSGYIIREDGKSVVWVNGKSELSPGHSQERIRTSVPRNGSESVYVSRDDIFARMKPGQVWSVSDKKVKEAYEALPKKEKLEDTKAIDSIEEPEASIASNEEDANTSEKIEK